MEEALFYEKKKDKSVDCFLCNHYCHITEDHSGVCRVRHNLKGVLYSMVYGKLIASHSDPIEKKPLFHFLPGTESFSIATAGCNFQCSFCQNWQISQRPKKEGVKGENYSPRQVVDAALNRGCKSISYTYTEPTIFYEFAYDTGLLARDAGLKNVFVTNGYTSLEALDRSVDFLDAANVDLKAFTDDFYKRMCGASLKPVLDSIKKMHDLGIWLEITTLLIPGKNDSDEELRDIACFIASLDESIPWHVSRYRPAYEYNGSPPTPISTIKRAIEIGKEEGLNHIYAGNIGEGENTFCPECNELLIERNVFFVRENNLKEGRCSFCDSKIKGIWA